MKTLDNVLTEKFFKECFSKKMNSLQMGKLVGCSKSSINRYLKKLGFNNFYHLSRIFTKEFIIEEHHKKEKTPDQIAQEVGCTSTPIYLYCKKYGIKIIDWYTERINRILTKDFLQKNYPKFNSYEIGKKIGCDPSTVIQRLRYFGFKVEKPHRYQKGDKLSSETVRKILKKVCASPNKFEQKCLNYLNKKYPSKFVYCGDGSFLIGGRSPDAVAKELNIAVLFHGNYFHCNPKIYKANYYSKQLKQTAQEIWDRDKKVKQIFKKAGYKVWTIWEKDLK